MPDVTLQWAYPRVDAIPALLLQLQAPIIRRLNPLLIDGWWGGGCRSVGFEPRNGAPPAPFHAQIQRHGHTPPYTLGTLLDRLLRRVVVEGVIRALGRRLETLDDDRPGDVGGHPEAALGVQELFLTQGICVGVWVCETLANGQPSRGARRPSPHLRTRRRSKMVLGSRVKPFWPFLLSAPPILLLFFLGGMSMEQGDGGRMWLVVCLWLIYM